MKKSTLAFCILLANLALFGKNKKIGISLQVNSPSVDNINVGWFNVEVESIDGYNLKHKSYSSGILVNYNINDETTIRLRLGMTKNFIEEYRDEYMLGVRYIDSNKGQQTKFHFAPGIIWKMNKKKLDLYGGFEIPINLHGKYTMDWVYTNTDSLMGNITVSGEKAITIPKGYSFGVGALIGFNYFPIKWFSLGAEFAPSLLYAKLSGKTTTINTQTIPINTINTSYTHDKDEGITFYEQRFSINLSIWF